MATQNTINKKSGSLTIDPGVSGDSYLQLDINGTGEFRIGVDDDASDAFKISQGSALGGTDTFIMSAAGQRTMPLQPCFRVEIDSDITNVTGDGTAYTVIWDNEAFDIGSNMTTTTFTAPVDGKYLLYANLYMSDVAAGNTTGMIQLVAGGTTYTGGTIGIGKIFSTDFCSRYITEIIDLTASDTVTVVATVSGATKIIDLLGSATTGAVYSQFFGILLT